MGRYGIANSRYDVPNFCDEWLAAGERIQTAFRDSPTVARDVDIPWIRTRQDAKVKLMVSNSRFPMMGGGVLRGEIPVGWNTGQHAHGEESLRVLRGRGFSGHRPTEIGLARDPVTGVGPPPRRAAFLDLAQNMIGLRGLRTADIPIEHPSTVGQPSTVEASPTVFEFATAR